MSEGYGGSIYTRDEVVQGFYDADVWPVEAMLLLKYRNDLAGRSVLDVGVGGGRLARVIAPVATFYVGLDRSMAMLRAASQPGSDGDVDLVLGDIRALTCFGEASFDSCLIPWNTLDIVTPAERGELLRAVHALLRPGGLLLFSSQNRYWRGLQRRPVLQWSRNPVTTLARLARAAADWRRWKDLRRQEYETADHAVWVQPDHGFSMLHCFTDRDGQEEELATNGFILEGAFDERCHLVGPGDRAPHAGTIHYVARPGSSARSTTGTSDES